MVIGLAIIADSQVGPLGAFALMTKANIGLGVLSIPFVFMEVGMVPGVILLLVINLIIMCE